MKFNEKQTNALDDIYGMARIYTKIAVILNSVVDGIRTTADEIDDGDNVVNAEYLNLFTRAQVNYAKDMMQATCKELSQCTNNKLNELNDAFKIES